MIYFSVHTVPLSSGKSNYYFVYDKTLQYSILSIIEGYSILQGDFKIKHIGITEAEEKYKKIPTKITIGSRINLIITPEGNLYEPINSFMDVTKNMSFFTPLDI